MLPSSTHHMTQRQSEWLINLQLSIMTDCRLILYCTSNPEKCWVSLNLVTPCQCHLYLGICSIVALDQILEGVQLQLSNSLVFGYLIGNLNNQVFGLKHFAVFPQCFQTLDVAFLQESFFFCLIKDTEDKRKIKFRFNGQLVFSFRYFNVTNKFQLCLAARYSPV